MALDLTVGQQLANYRSRLDIATEEKTEEECVLLHEEFVKWLAHLEESAIDCLEKEDYLVEHQEFFTACQRRYLAVKESQEVQLLFTKENISGNKIYPSLISEFAKKAYQRVKDLSLLVDLSSYQHFVMVGCGALPATLFYLHDQKQTAHYIGLDIEPQAIATAQEAQRILGVDGISFVVKNGCQFDYAKAELVYIANQVFPKASVLQRIADTVNQDVQILLRDPTRRGKLLADCGQDALPPQFSVVRRGSDCQHFLSVDLLLRLHQ